MEQFKTKTKVKKNHLIEISNVPFEDGEEVVITISKKDENSGDMKLKELLKGSVLKYDEPFDPAISSDDWELLK